jgi:polyisoprenoid-binding protein YceI
MESKNFEIVSSESNIDWVGKKVTGAHNGTIAIKGGTLNFNNGKLTGGEFTIDTTSIKILDVTDPATNAQFAGHLASEDFFSIEEFPAATLEITSVTPKAGSDYHIEGNLTIKGISHSIGFDAEVNNNGDTVNASGKIVIDRTKYNMKFRSGNFFKDLGDTLIYNEFELHVNITAKAA